MNLTVDNSRITTDSTTYTVDTISAPAAVVAPGVGLSADQAAALAMIPDLAQAVAALATLVAGQVAPLADIVTKLQTLGTAAVAVQSPLTANGAILNLVRGDDYRAADGRQIGLTFANAPVLTGGQANLLIGNVTIPGTVTGPASARFEPTAAETGALLANGAYNALSPTPYSPAYKVQAVLADGHVVTLCTGTCKVL